MKFKKTDQCVLMFSGGRDSTIAALRLREKFKHLILVTVLSRHLVGIENVYKRILEIKKYLAKETEWFQIFLPELVVKDKLRNITCLPCQRAYIVTGLVIAQRQGIADLAMGYSGYQNSWPEQTPYATDNLRTALASVGIRLHLPVYDIKEKADALKELAGAGLEKESYEQKCLKQKYNVELYDEVLKGELDRWIAGLTEVVKSKTVIDLNIRYHGTIGDVREDRIDMEGAYADKS